MKRGRRGSSSQRRRERLSTSTTRDFVELMLAHTTHDLWVCALPNDKGAKGARHVRTRDVEDIVQFCTKHDVPGTAVYYCVSSINGTSRNLETVAETPILWFDLDYKDVTATPEQALAQIRQLPFPPTRIHATGHGLHGIYVLDKPWHGDIKPALRKLCDVIGGDTKVCHPAALLRMPGTHNSKDEPAVLVRALKTTGRTCTHLELCLWLASQGAVIHRKGAQAPDTDPFKRHAKSVGFAPPIDAEARLRAMRWKGPGGDTSIHQTQLQVTASLLEQGMGEDEVVERVLDATREAVEGRPDWNWDGEDRSLHGMCTSWHKKHPPKPEKKRKPLAKRPNIDKPIVTADPNQQVDRRDDDEPAGAQVFNLAVARAERDIKKADKKAVHVVLGRGLLDALAERSEPILYEGVWMHRYRRGLWERVFPDLAAMWINTETQIGCESLGITPSTRLRSEVRNWIASVQELQHEEVPWDKHGGIATRSGLFNLKTMKIEPLKPEHYATRCVDSEYDAKATCPWWIRMLEDTFPDDQDTIDVLQEIAGAALLAYKPRTLNKALLLRGETNSGKSNILIVLASMFGGTPITQPLAKIDGNHGLQPFVQHAPWLLTEAFERSGWHPSSTVKKILSGEAVTIDPKNAPQVTHIFRGPVFWGSNYPAKFKEASKAMIERIRPIPCEVEFDPENPVGAAEEAGKRGYDHPYDLVLENERPGVLNWMLEGLIRARARGFIKNTHYMVDELAAVRTESNSVAGFVAAGCAELDEKFMVLKSDLLAAITMWHSSEYSTDHRTLSNNEIKQEIKASYANRLVDYRSDGEDYYVGVELTNKGLRFWSSVNDPFRRVAAGKVAELSLDHDKVNRTSPVTLKEARALRAQRREADRERKRHG